MSTDQMTTAPTTETFRGFLGRTPAGDRVFVTIELRERTGAHQTVEHVEALNANGETVTVHPTADGYLELSITGDLVEKGRSRISTCGQLHEEIGSVARGVPAAGLTPADALTVALAAEQWHLNGMQAGCAHQTPIGETTSDKLALTPVCPETGYRWGSAWLVRTLPAAVVDTVRELGAKLDGQYIGNDDRVHRLVSD